MTTSWRHLPVAARPIAAATEAAVTAARARDSEAMAKAIGDLVASDPGVGLILGTGVRLLLEDQHPDGLTGDDVRTVLQSCVRSAAEWQSDVDPHAVLMVLAGALGVHGDDDGEPAPKLPVLARHAVLLIADQLGDRSIRDCLDQALAEIERAQLND